jgi:hypothetical protein
LLLAAFAAGWLAYGIGSAAAAVVDVRDALNPPHQLPSGTAPSEPSRSAPAGQPDALELVVAGIGHPLASNDAIPIAGDLAGRLRLNNPGDRHFSRTFDLSLYRGDEPAQPVEGARVKATARMRDMDHGTFEQVAIPTGAGHYLLSLAFPMPGAWRVEVDVATPDTRGAIELDLDLWN